MNQNTKPDAPAAPWFDFEEFAALTGFSSGLKTWRNSGEIKWTNTATDMRSGCVHGLRYKVEKGLNSDPQIVLQHWVYWPGGKVPAAELKKRNPQPLTLRTETRMADDGRIMIRPTAVDWMGKTYTDYTDVLKFMHLLHDTAHEIAANNVRLYESVAQPTSGASRQTKRRDEIPNLYSLAQQNDIRTIAPLEGMYYNGEFNFPEPVNATESPVYPVQLLRAMLAIEEDALEYGMDESFSHSVVVPRHDTAGGYNGISYAFKPGAGGAFEITGTLTETDSRGQRAETRLYKIAFAPIQDGKNLYRLSGLEMLGNTPDLNDHKGAARVIRALKYIHMAIQRNEAPQIGDILHEHDLKAYLRSPGVPENGPENPRVMIQVFGANTDAAVSRKEMSIGSNGLVMIRDFVKDGKWIKQGIGIDWGVTFGDPQKDHYHTIAPNYARFTRHPNAAHIKPFVNTILNLETHEHEDHLRGLAKLAKYGYTMPPAVMNEHTQRVYKRMMQGEGVDKMRVREILDNTLLVKIDRYRAPEDPSAIKTHIFGDTVVEVGTEIIWSEEEQVNKYFPLLHAYDVNHPESRCRIRVGPAGHSAQSLMFEVDGVLYTGDYKMDQTKDRARRTDRDWLRKCADSGVVHIMESTNATKMVPYNPPISEVTENRKDILRRHIGDDRILADLIGSNSDDIEAFARAVGEVRKESMAEGNGAPYRYMIFAGASIRNKYSDLNMSDAFRDYLRREYGIIALHASSEKAKNLLRTGSVTGGAEDSSKEDREDDLNPASYVVVMTGTQDENLSVTHRVSRDLHDDIRLRAGDVVLRLQMPIPVDNNVDIRTEQNNRYRHDFGCVVYDAGEMASQQIHIYASSHASQDDARQVHHETGGKLIKLLHHGGPRQLAAQKALIEAEGGVALIPNKQALYQVDRTAKTVTVAGETPEERIGYREIRSDEQEFYKKRRQQATVIRVRDSWGGPVAEAMARYEQSLSRRGDQLQSAAINRGANLTQQFDDAASNRDFPLIGVLHPNIRNPYYTEHKNIKLFIAEDAETTGPNVGVDRHTDISFVAARLDGKILGRRTLKQALPKYHMASLGALLVTRNNQPEELYKGLSQRKFAYRLHQTYREWPKKLSRDKDARAVFIGYRNTVFDDNITMRTLGMSLAANDMKPMATYGNLQIDLYNVYTAMIALCPDKVNVARDKAGNAIRTLRAACLNNGINYDDSTAHGSAADSQWTLELFQKFREMAPDIVEQMLMNADFSDSRRSPMIDHILGQDTHINDNAPVFGYVDMRDRTCTPRLGALVTIDTKVSHATDAIVVDLTRADVHKMETLPDDKLLEMMNDPKGPFAVVRLNKSPLLFPPQFVMRDAKVRAKALGRMPKSTLQLRANALREVRANATDSEQNLIQRVQRLYPQSRLRLGGGNAEVPANANTPAAQVFRLPNERAFSLFQVIKRVSGVKNRHYRAAADLLKSLTPTAYENRRDFDREGFWREAVERADEISRQSGGRDRNIEDMRFLVKWMVYDINPKWLSAEDRAQMNALKSAMLHGPENATTMTVERFRRDIRALENDPEQFKRLVGDDDGAQARWTSLKAAFTRYANTMESKGEYAMTDEKRERLRAFRRSEAAVALPRRQMR